MSTAFLLSEQMDILYPIKEKKGLEEISNAQNCMNVLGCKIEKVDDFRLEEDEAERLLIRIKKCKGTPKLYPRKAGTPSKNPL